MVSVKKILVGVGLLLVSAIAVAGDTFNAPGQSFEQVFETPGHTRDQIFTSSKIWVAENFKSAKAVFEYESKEEGTLIGNGLIPFPCKGAFDCLGKGHWKVRFTMRVDMKDDRFRLTFSNIGLVWAAAVYNGVVSPANDGGAVHSQKDRDKIQAALLAFGPQLQAAMTTSARSDDW